MTADWLTEVLMESDVAVYDWNECTNPTTLQCEVKSL